MRTEVSAGIEELKRQFPDSTVVSEEDGQGGARVIMEPVSLGPKYAPPTTWIGFHVPAQYPYADIYPVFIGKDVKRCDGIAFAVPITPGHAFQGRPALQISRRSSAAQAGLQRVPVKILKILAYLENIAS